MKEIEIKIYVCEICGTNYSSREEAEQCERYGKPKPKFRVGQKMYLDMEGYVTIKPRYEVTISGIRYSDPTLARCPDRSSRMRPHTILYDVTFDNPVEAGELDLMGGGTETTEARLLPRK